MRLTGKTKKIIVSTIIVLLIVTGATWIVRRIRLSRRTDKIAGTYLVAGGESYITIDKGFLGKPVVTEGKIIDWREYPYFEPAYLKVGILSNRLFLKQKTVHQRLPLTIVFLASEDVYETALTLKPSETISGDWDLVRAEVQFSNRLPLKTLFSKHFWNILVNDFRVKKFLRSFYSIFSEDSLFLWELPKNKTSVPSCLHKISHFQLPTILKNLAKGVYDEKTLEAVRNLYSQNTDDPWIGFMAADIEARHGNFLKAEKLFHKSLKKAAAMNNPFLIRTSERVEKTIHNNRLNKKCGLPLETVFKVESKGYLKKDRFCLFKGEPHKYFFYYFPYMTPFQFKNVVGINFLELQVGAKVNRVNAEFSLITGKREQALDILKNNYNLAASLYYGEAMTCQLIGIALRAITTASLEMYALNACENREEQSDFWKLLEKLNSLIDYDPGIFHKTKWGSIVNLYPAGTIHWSTLIKKENETRGDVTEMRFQLLRAGAAAKFILSQQGQFPLTEDDYNEYFPQNLPEDIFNKPESLKRSLLNADTLAIYSHGPDKDDDKSMILYDPTNGTISDGDIFVKVPRQRKYPFPENGLKANTARDVLKQFPNGLPADPFADTKGMPYSILHTLPDPFEKKEPGTVTPLVIFSWGPDTDYYKSGVAPLGPNPVPTPAPPPDASWERAYQRIFMRSRTKPVRPGNWPLEPPYDPTNGIVSNGDLFIEITPLSE